MFSSLGYSIKNAFIQIFRNKGMTAASVFSITAMLLILAIFFFVAINVNYATEVLKTQFDKIEVFLLEDTTPEQAQAMLGNLRSMGEVKSAEYITKEQAMEEFKVSWGNNAYLLDGLTENPLPNSIRVELSDLKYGNWVAETCRNFIGVEDVRYYQEEVNQILRVSDILQKVALVFIVFLLIVSLMIVFNTIKIAVMARQQEIEIMKYVGATNWFIQGPMMAQGIITGALSAIIASGLTAYGYIKLNENFGQQAAALFSIELVEPEFMIRNLIWIFMSIGISIGAFGSILAVRKFLRV